MESWYNQALAGYNAAGVNYSDVVIYTPVSGSQPKGDGPPQEYIGIVDPVPEPGTLLLMVTGLLGLLVFWRRFSN